MNFLTNKILVFISVFATLIIVVELSIFLFLRNFGLSSSRIEKVTNSSTCFVSDSINSGLNDSLIESYRHAPLKSLGNLYLIDRTEGIISHLNYKESQIQVNKMKYPNASITSYRALATIEYISSSNEKVIEVIPSDNRDKTFYFQKNESTKKTTSIALSDLKIGDKIVVESKIDLRNKNCVSYLCVVESIITKYY